MSQEVIEQEQFNSVWSKTKAKIKSRNDFNYNLLHHDLDITGIYQPSLLTLIATYVKTQLQWS